MVRLKILIGREYANQGDIPNIASMPSVQESLTLYCRFLFSYFVPASLLFSVIPLSETLYLGNNGNVLFAPIAPLILLIASGLVCVSWWILAGLLTIIERASSFLFKRSVFVGFTNVL